MREGDVVMVVGNLDARVRDNDIRMGTIVSLDRDEVIVLLTNGDLWRGPKRDVILQNEQDESN